MPTSNAEIYRRREEAVERLTEVVARHKAKGDYKTAAVFAELLVEAQDRLREIARNTPNPITSMVRVGDHDPEPRYEVSDRIRLPYNARRYGVGSL